MSSNESATSRLSRLLTMVPWLLNRQGIDIEEAARELGVSTEQIEEDLQLLFVCGTPGHMPDDLIEAEWEGGKVYLGNADPIARPLRLGVDEAIALIAGLRALAAVPGIGDREAVDRALAKLEAATGQLAEASSRIRVTIDEGSEAGQLTSAQRAVAEHRRLHLRYLVAARDEATERDVDPMRVLNVDGTWYLEAWCHRAEDVRLFRFDRMERLDLLDEDGTPPSEARQRNLDAGVFAPAPTDLRVRLRLAPSASWVADYYPTESVTEHDDGSRTVVLRTADTAWLRRLLLRLGGQATVLEPADLAAEVADTARRALDAYADHAGSFR
ncbi:MAG TPA: WYL domain-containing protein [Segeticoccus sp.]|uniref:helix-turn-helix transcriptional regulator n=1 Tax=Segeticoccus sp. TaxID=2706531 RepID=UPI002D7E6E6E|nr:WYL domain-containing protein [Segeticoccus sp.]HET8598945.1 WYL domain-containing protein [Segeticoccus sp.]